MRLLYVRGSEWSLQVKAEPNKHKREKSRSRQFLIMTSFEKANKGREKKPLRLVKEKFN